MNGTCTGCQTEAWLIPLHGDKGGPLKCFLCRGEWHAEYTRRRKWGRIIIKAMNMFLKEGGRWSDINKLRLYTGGGLNGLAERLLPGYEDTIGVEVGDITSELLADTLQLTHPDRHPPERKSSPSGSRKNCWRSSLLCFPHQNRNRFRRASRVTRLQTFRQKP